MVEDLIEEKSSADDEARDLVEGWVAHRVTVALRAQAQRDMDNAYTDLMYACERSTDPRVASALVRLQMATKVAATFGGKLSE